MTSAYHELGAYEQYMSRVRHTPQLSAEREVYLLDLVTQGKLTASHTSPDRHLTTLAESARAELVEGYQPLVLHLARRYVRFCKSMDILDLAQEGSIGLIHAIDRHDAAKGYPLITLAGRSIRGAILSALSRRDRVVRVPAAQLTALKQMTAVERRLFDVLGRDATVQEIACEMQIEEGRIIDLLDVRALRSVTSLQHVISEDHDEDAFNLTSLFADTEKTGHPEYIEHLAQVLEDAINTLLTPRQRDIIRLRFGIGDEYEESLSQCQVAARLGVSREAVRNREQEAKVRLARALQGVVAGGQMIYTLQRTRHAEYYTAKEAMQLLGKSTTSFYKQVYKGVLPSKRLEGKKNVWLFPKDAIDALVNQTA